MTCDALIGPRAGADRLRVVVALVPGGRKATERSTGAGEPVYRLVGRWDDHRITRLSPVPRSPRPSGAPAGSVPRAPGAGSTPPPTGLIGWTSLTPARAS
ncbi:hypothetical protein GCM10010428_20690 [Actinosynnema pretiosum subsp. pretiosum]